MITFRQLSLQRGNKLLFEQIDLIINARQRVGLTGANGTGKSTLFAMLRGELHPDAGDLLLPPRLTISHVAQETPATDIAAIEYVIDGDAELRSIERQLAVAEAADDGHLTATLHAQFDAADGYTARSRAAQLMDGLGFTQDQTENPVNTFSGGWRMRLNLAQALMCRSDLLLLDEPTNHLDLDAVLWLEQWLRNYAGTLLLISHDRDFLDATVESICHLENRQLKLYTGNYGDFERQRAANLALQQSAFEKQQRDIKHLQSYVERFRAKATKARQAQSRIKALARMEIISAAHVDSPFTFGFRQPQSSPNPLLRLEDVTAGYGDKPILHNIELRIDADMRLGLLGPNGAGKSTLIRLLANVLPPMHGKLHEGKGLKIGYFAQHQLEQLRADETPIQHLQRIDSQAREQDLRNFLGSFNFSNDTALAPIAPFSGGEKARLALALIIWQRPNLLLLDEPTNHLDLEMRHALTVALQDYEGALVVVSHDRHLIRTTTDRLMLVADGRVNVYDGDLDDYRDWLAQQRANKGELGGDKTVSSSADRKQQKRDEAEQRNRLAVLRRPLEAEIKKLEKEMDKLNGEKNQLEATLADSGIYEEQNKTKLKDAVMRQSQILASLSNAEEKWLVLHDELERIASEAMC